MKFAHKHILLLVCWCDNADMDCTFRTPKSDAMNITIIVDESSTKGFKVSRFPLARPYPDTTARHNPLPKLHCRYALAIWTNAPAQLAAKKDSSCSVSSSLCVYLRDCLHVCMLPSWCASRAFIRKEHTKNHCCCAVMWTVQSTWLQIRRHCSTSTTTFTLWFL